jgi:four helix bundle protein
MARINRFEEIEAWQAARLLTRRIYEITNQGAFAHDFGLRDQMRRAALSVIINLQSHSHQETNV